MAIPEGTERDEYTERTRVRTPNLGGYELGGRSIKLIF